MLNDFCSFLENSPTTYHASKEIIHRLSKSGFHQIHEKNSWQLEPGKGYWLLRDDALLVAFRMPNKKPQGTILLASHLDSPALKLKPQPLIFSSDIGQVGVETYGGPLLYTWFDRDLAIAGRVWSEKGSELLFLTDTPLIIPSIAIHLNREVNEKGFQINKQDHLRAIFTTSNKEIPQLKDVKAADLFLVPTEKPAFLGIDQEFFASYRLDNLTSAFASLQALLQTKALEETVQMAIFWEHEEIGSKTFLGADSLFMDQVLERLVAMDREALYRLKARSFCLSCDVGHGYHPNYTEKFDPQNASYIGKGPVIKFSSKYATNGSSAHRILSLASQKKIPTQTYASRSDLSCGSTVGSLMGANLGIATVDLGICCWAMHSTRETISVQDQNRLEQLLKAALEHESL